MDSSFFAYLTTIIIEILDYLKGVSNVGQAQVLEEGKRGI